MSKGLEALKRVVEWFEIENVKDIEIIEEELKEGEKAQFKLKALGNFVLKSKALEIIKDKKVNVPNLITLFKSQTSYEEYEQLWDNDIRWQLTKNWDIQFSRKKLTQEEYDLLKEVGL